MKHLFLTVTLALGASAFGHGQTAKSCKCPETQYAETKADAIFHLANGKTIALCGYKNPETKPATYSEFVLAVCGSDTIIGFWGAVSTCRLRVHQDTLLVETPQNLPTGREMRFQEVIWTTEKISFEGEKLVRKLVVNRQLRKYNRGEIQTVLKSYEKAKFSLDDDRKMAVLNRLFVATISGDKKARQYFNEFKTKPGILGEHYLEEYDALVEMLQLWKK